MRTRIGRVFERLYGSAVVKEPNVREITYEQFQELRGSGEEFILVDVLSPESYENGHIEGAISFPVETIDQKTAPEILKQGVNVVVYCGGFDCIASTTATKKLAELGYRVLDYKGGLKEWQEKGNRIVAFHKI